MKNKKDFNKDNEEVSFFIYFILILCFFIPFFLSFFFTSKYISRDSAVSEDEEANLIDQNLNIDDLNKLYLNHDKKNNSSKPIILGYHQVREYKDTDGIKTKLFITSPEIFEKEIKYLYTNGYHTISVSDYINNINHIDNKDVVITFDDGYISQYINAFPILKKYNFTATFFIYTDCVDKYPVCMTSDNIKDLANSGMKIANHTTHHAFLTKYNNSTIIKEIEDNQNKLISLVGLNSMENILAYPYGANDQRVREIVKKEGYIGAVGVLPSGDENIDIYNLRRYLLGNNYSFFENLFNKK